MDRAVAQPRRNVRGERHVFLPESCDEYNERTGWRIRERFSRRCRRRRLNPEAGREVRVSLSERYPLEFR